MLQVSEIPSAESQFWPFLRLSASLVLPLHPVPVLLSSTAHLSLPLSSLGKSVEITFHYLAPQGSSNVPPLDRFCPGRRNGFSKFFHFPFAIFPVRYLARSVHKCRSRVGCCASHCLGAVAEVTLAEGHSPRLALKFSPWSLEISPFLFRTWSRVTQYKTWLLLLILGSCLLFVYILRVTVIQFCFI